jgi:type VI secretion system secreted protein Hcp
MSNSGTFHTGGGGGGGKVNVQDLAVTKWIDKASPTLMLYCATGDQFAKARLTVRKAGGKEPLEYLIVDMTDVLITSLSTGGSGGEDKLTENISLNFRMFEVAYTVQKPDGTADGAPLTFAWDIAANTKG